MGMPAFVLEYFLPEGADVISCRVLAAVTHRAKLQLAEGDSVTPVPRHQV